ENTPNITGSGPNWLFDIDALTKSMNYKPVVVGNQSNGNVATILQISSAIHHFSNNDNMYIKSYSFSLFSSHPGVLTPVRAINGFDMPLPVAVCSGLVNPLAPRKGKFHGGLITMSTLCT
ncbi:hypothetical protein Tco_0070231, partial [Tanacetum coccineum]